MAQYKTGTVSVTNGSATVTGTGTAFSANLTAGNLFTVEGDNVAYTIASAPTATSLTLTAPYGGTTGSGKTYGVTIDFTPDIGLPLMSIGDLNTAAIYNEAMKNIDNLNLDDLGTAAFADLTTSSTDVSGVQRAEDLNRFYFNAGSGSQILAAGNAVATSSAIFYLPTDLNNVATSTTLTGMLEVVSPAGVSYGDSITSITLLSRRSPKVTAIFITGLSGMTVNESLELRSFGGAASILIG